MSKVIGNTTAAPKVLTEDEIITLVTDSEEVQNLIKEIGATEETDPTVPAWAKAETKPSYTSDEIGLGNVDNTSDEAKPVSTAQAIAIADAKKAGTDAQGNLDVHIANKNNPHGVTASQIGAAEVSHNQAANSITAGTFAGQVVAKGDAQAPDISLLRNSKILPSTSTEEPTQTGEIYWYYS